MCVYIYVYIYMIYMFKVVFKDLPSLLSIWCIVNWYQENLMFFFNFLKLKPLIFSISSFKTSEMQCFLVKKLALY